VVFSVERISVECFLFIFPEWALVSLVSLVSNLLLARMFISVSISVLYSVEILDTMAGAFLVFCSLPFHVVSLPPFVVVVSRLLQSMDFS